MSFFQKSIILLATTILVSACQPTSMQPVEKFQQSVDGAYAADISQHAKYSVISSIHHGISLWDINKNALLFTWSQQQKNADSLVLLTDIANDNSYTLTANRNDFALWDMKTGKSAGYWRIKDSTIRDIAVSNQGRYLLIGRSDGKVEHITLSTGRRLEFLGHKDKINAVDMLPNGRVAISGGNDFIAYVWDTKTGQVIYQFNHPTRVSKVALDPQGRFAFTADSRKSANIWDLKTGKLISQLKYSQRQEIFSSVRFSDDGKYLLTGAPSRTVSLWQIASGKRLKSWQVSRKDAKHPTGAVVYGVAFGDNTLGKQNIYTISSSGYVEKWQVTL